MTFSKLNYQNRNIEGIQKWQGLARNTGWDVFGHKITLHNDVPYVLESNPHPFYSFRGQKIRCGSESRAD